MLAITVTVGRNIGTHPMHHQVWADFQDDAEAIIVGAASGAQIWTERHYGETMWTDAEGAVIHETSARLTVLGAEHFDADAAQAELRLLADQYDQDAVALTYGESVLVGRASAAPAKV
jgi:hypothetical protein